MKVCWDSDVHFSDFFRQMAMRNQVKNSELPNQKKRKSTKDEDDTIESIVIEMNQHVLQTNGDTKPSKKTRTS